MNVREAAELTGGLSSPSKMPCHSYSIPARLCKTGSKLRKVKGSVCEGCYAMKGFYHMGNVKLAMDRRFASLRHPQWVEAMTVLIASTRNPHFRWHDSGDVQGVWHLRKICQVAEALPDVRFWLPTKEYKIIREYFVSHTKPANLTVRLSLPRVDQVATGREGFPVSQVHSAGVLGGAIECPSRTQGHKCLDCRMCWDERNYAISYQEH